MQAVYKKWKSDNRVVVVTQFARRALDHGSEFMDAKANLIHRER